jgi:hypothetical protein
MLVNIALANAELAEKQENAGERGHGIASAHSGVAVATVIAYAGAMVAASWPIRLQWRGVIRLN